MSTGEERKLVAKHNKLIEYKGRMTVIELKLFSLIVGSVREMQEGQFEKYEIDVSLLKENTKDKNFYNFIRDVALRLEEKRLVVEKLNYDGRRQTTTIRLINKPVITENYKKLEVYVDKDLVPYIIDLKREFTTYEIQNILKMKSSYSVRIYELLKQYENMANSCRKFSIIELREFLGIDDNEYSRFVNFENRVLKVAVDEINLLTDISVNYKKIKKGRKIEFIFFEVSYKDKQFVKYLEETYNIEELKKLAGLEKENWNAKRIMDLYELALDKTNDEIDASDYIKMNYNYILAGNKARNRYAYLLKAIENDFAKAYIQLKNNYIVQETT